MKIVFATLLLLVLNEISIGQNNLVKIFFNKDNFSQNVQVNYDIYVLIEGYYILLSKETDSTYTYEDIPKEIDRVLSSKKKVKIMLRGEKKCFVTISYNMFITDYTVEFEFYKNDKGRLGLGVSKGPFYFSPILYWCDKYTGEFYDNLNQKEK